MLCFHFFRSARPGIIFFALGSLLASMALAAAPPYIVDSGFQTPQLLLQQTFGAKVTVLPDDSVFVFSRSSGFHRYDNDPTGSLVRFKPDGSLDTSFALDKALLEYAVNVVTAASDGKLLIACRPLNRFFPLNHRVFRLHGNGAIDPTFDAGPGSGPTSSLLEIRALAVASDGKVLVGGFFTDFSGSGRRYLVRLNNNGSVDSSFANFNITKLSPVSSSAAGILTDTGLALQPDGKILVAGAFSEINGVPRLCVARLNQDGTVDPGFVPSGYNPASLPFGSSKRPISSVAVQPGDGKVVLGGIFNPVNGPPPQLLVRLESNGSVDSSFNAERTSVIGTLGAWSLELLADGRILIVPQFTTASRLAVYRFAANGESDIPFSQQVPSFAGMGSSFRMESVAAQSDGRIFCAGDFVSAGGAPRPGVTRLNDDGTLETGFAPGPFQREQLPAQIALRSDGKIVIGGSFDSVNGVARPGLALLERSGSLHSQTPATPFTGLAAPRFSLQPDDKLIVFGQSPGFAPTYLRLNFDGLIDNTFAADPGIFTFNHVLPLPDGDLLLSGGDSAQAVVDGAVLTRINPDGSKDGAFTPEIDVESWVEREAGTGIITYIRASGDNRALLALPDGKTLFKFYGGGLNYRVVSLDSTGAFDPAFQEGAAQPLGIELTSPQVYDRQNNQTLQPSQGVVHPLSTGPTTALRLPDGKMILAGQFSSYNGVATGGIIRLNANGSVDSALGSGATFLSREVTPADQPSVTAIQLELDGKFLVAGNFEAFHGVLMPGIARLHPDGSLDPTFLPPVVSRTRGVAFTNESLLLRERAGRFLLVGNYGTGSNATDSTSIFRLEIPVRTKAIGKTSGSGLQILFTGVPGEIYTIQSSPSVAFDVIDPGSPALQASENGDFFYEDATAFGSLQRFYRAVSSP